MFINKDQLPSLSIFTTLIETHCLTHHQWIFENRKDQIKILQFTIKILLKLKFVGFYGEL